MFSRMRSQFGTAGLVIAIVALVAALAGGAYAASGGLSGKQKKEVKKIAQTEAKKSASAGPAGAKGDTGARGDAGAKGEPGAAGTSATTAPFSGVKGSCTEGGVEVKSASPTVNVCNGAEGQSGFTATLPHGETETGSFAGLLGSELTGVATASFAIPLAAPLDAAHVHIVEKAQVGGTGCTGGTSQEPKADAGNLCVYVAASEGASQLIAIKNTGESNLAGAGRNGAVLVSAGDEANQTIWGSWAVTAP